MRNGLTMIIGGTIGVGMMVGALWSWQGALRLSAAATRPEIELWAVRSGAIALAALAQAILLTCVVGRVYRRGFPGEMLRLAAGLVGAVALVSAVALGLAGH
jgi:hypothetical protein